MVGWEGCLRRGLNCTGLRVVFGLQGTGLEKVLLGPNPPKTPRGRPASMMAALMHFNAVASTDFVTGRGKAYPSRVQTGKFGEVVAAGIGEDLISR